MTEVTANLILISICLSVFELIWKKNRSFQESVRYASAALCAISIFVI